MNIWGILGIVISIIGFISGVWIGLENYIDYKAELIANNKILEQQIRLQNQAVLEKKLQVKAYNENIENINKTISKQIPQTKTSVESSCQEKLGEVERMLESIYPP